MSILDDTFCQLCERFITKQKWNDHLYSKRFLHREAHCFWPACFPEGELTRDENVMLKKAFWKICFATRRFKEVEEFWITYFMMVTTLNDYVTDSQGFKKVFRVNMECQSEHDLYNKSFSNQLEPDKMDILQQRIKRWMRLLIREVQNRTLFMNIALPKCLICIVKL